MRTTRLLLTITLGAGALLAAPACSDEDGDGATTDEEIQASALQFVRKLSGFSKPSKANEAAFNKAVEEVSDAARTLIHSLVTLAPPRDRAEVRARAIADAARDDAALRIQSSFHGIF